MSFGRIGACGFEPVQQPSASIHKVISVEVGSGGDRKREQNSCHSGMHARLQHGKPDANADQGVYSWLANSQKICPEGESYQEESDRETGKVDLRRVENCDDKYCNNVIHDSQCGDEDLQRRRDSVSEQEEHTESE